MLGLMQETPLTLQMVLRRAESLYGDKTVSTKTADGIRTRTYAETIDRVNRLATALRELGVGPGDRVGTFGWNSDRHVEAYLAVPCMGAVLHTLNIRLHPDQIAWIADHAQDKVVLVDASLAEVWNQVKSVDSVQHVIVMDDTGQGAGVVAGALDYEELIAGAAGDYDWPELDERAAAAMCYTSGTTGNPKGVVYSHRSSTLHTMASLFADSIAVSERDVCLPIVPQFHANAWGLVYAALMTGASLAMPSRFMDPVSISTLVSETGVTMSGAVPTVWLGVIQAIKAGQIDVSTLRTLNRIAIGGSACPEALMRAFDEIGVRVMHAWGMTETSPVGTMAKVKSTIPAERELEVRLTQGVPLPTLDLRVVGEDGGVQPWDGESMGELQITGPWIAAAYYDPDAPDGRGGEDRFTDAEGRRWLKTGDVAVIDPHGYVKLVDRTKDLVKSGGEWISTVELENLLIAHPKVAEAAVIAVPHPKWDERPLACVVKADDSATKEELLEHLAQHVAKWQVPDDVVFVDEVPKTSVGKFDKKVLRNQFAEYSLPHEAELTSSMRASESSAGLSSWRKWAPGTVR